MGTKSLPGQRHLSGMQWVGSALWCRRPPGSNSGGTPIFGPLPFQGDSLETKKGERVRVNEGFLEICLLTFSVVKISVPVNQTIKIRKKEHY